MYIRTLFNVKDRQENMDELPGTNDSRAGVGAMLSATQHSRAGAGICIEIDFAICQKLCEHTAQPVAGHELG
jgi:hypothetical protein